MNIALLATGFSKKTREATKITVLSLAKQLMKRNYVAIITEGKKGLPKIDKEQGVPIFRSSFGKLLSYPLALAKAQKTSRKRFDIIHGFSSAPIFVMRSLLAKRLFSPRAKIIHTLKSYSRKEQGRKFMKVLNQADIVTVPTHIFKNKLVKSGVKKEKIHVVRSHLDLSCFFPKNKHIAKQKLGFKKKIIFFYGATWKEKGLDDLLKAFSILAKKKKDVDLVIAPRYPLEEEHRKAIRHLGITKRTKIMRGTIKVIDFLNAADICVLPYKNLIGTEGNPSCLLEAMACKTPVVTTDLPELREIINHCVILAKPSNPKSLSVFISKVLDNPQKRMIDKAFIKVREFDIKKIANKYSELYHL